MLVVADQVALGVGRQRGLARARQAEEQRDITVVAHVGGAVHRQYIHGREQVVLNGEHGFFHLAGIAHARQQHLALREVDDHRAVAVGAITLGHAGEGGHVQDLPLVAAARVVGIGPDEHVAGKEVLPCGAGGDPDGYVVGRVLAHVQMAHEAVVAIGEFDDTVPQRAEVTGVELAVDAAPVDVGAAAGLIDDEPVCRGAAGALAGGYHQRARVGQVSLLAPYRVLHQERGAQVGVEGAARNRSRLHHVSRVALVKDDWACL